MAAFVLDGRIDVRHDTAAFTDPDGPTQAELTGASDLVGTKQGEELIEINGWEKSPSSLPLPGYAGRDTGSLGGENTYPQSSLVWRMDSTVRTVYTLIVEGLGGVITMAQDGLGVGEEVEIFTIECVSKVRRKARNVPNAFEAAFTISAPLAGTQAA